MLDDTIHLDGVVDDGIINDDYGVTLMQQMIVRWEKQYLMQEMVLRRRKMVLLMVEVEAADSIDGDVSYGANVDVRVDLRDVGGVDDVDGVAGNVMTNDFDPVDPKQLSLYRRIDWMSMEIYCYCCCYYYYCCCYYC